MSSEGGRRGERGADWRDAGEKRPLTSVSTRQQHIAEMARKHAGSPLSTLSHHLDMLWMREAYGRVRKDSAPGVDGQTVADSLCAEQPKPPGQQACNTEPCP